MRNGSSIPDVQRMLGLVREIRAEAQNLQSSLAEVRQQTEGVDVIAQEQQVKERLEQHTALFTCNQQHISTRVAALRSLLDQNPLLLAGCGDKVVTIENAWERTVLAWPQAGHSGGQIVQRAEKADRQLNALVRQCGLLTIPDRANIHLRELPVGQPLDFHLTFQDELPLLEDRQEILAHIAAHPKAVEGVVDFAHGLIYRTSPHVYRQLLSLCWILLLPVVGGVALLLATRPAIAVLEPPFTAYLPVYLLLWGGGVAHVLVDIVKQERSGQGALALSGRWLWLHAKEASLMMGGLYLVIGFIGLLAWNHWQPIDGLTAFTVGYSIDSFVDIFLQRFHTFASASVEALKARI
jgi:hypothetical protein